MASSPTARPCVLVIHGPNLNLLGHREPAIYGRLTLAELDAQLVELGHQLGVRVTTQQRNGEGEIVTLIHSATSHDGLVINPGGYTHTSVAIADALRAVSVLAVEVHLSNLYGRESIRHTSLTGAACEGVVMGLGASSYFLALRYIAAMVNTSTSRVPSLGPDPSTTSRGPSADAPPERGC